MESLKIICAADADNTIVSLAEVPKFEKGQLGTSRCAVYHQRRDPGDRMARRTYPRRAEEKAPKAKKSRTAKPKKPSIRAQLDAAKKEQSKQTLPREKAKELEV